MTLILQFLFTFSLGLSRDVWALPTGNDPPKLPKPYQDMLLSPIEPLRLVSPDARKVLLLNRQATLPLELLSRESRGVAGQEVDTKRLSLKRRNFLTQARLLDLKTQKEQVIKLPTFRNISDFSFSPDSQWLAFTLDDEESVELYLYHVPDSQLQRISNLNVNGIFSEVFEWSPDSKYLFVPAHVRPRVSMPALKQELSVEESGGQKVAVRTFANLLKSEADVPLFEHLAQVQWHKIPLTLQTKAKAWGQAGLYLGLSFAPKASYVLVRRLAPPYSFAVPYTLFSQKLELWTLDERPKVRPLLDLPLAESVPPEGVRKGPRQIQWNPDAEAELLWLEALDDGDPRKKVEVRDRLMRWSFPFHGEAQELYRFPERVSELSFFTEQGRWLFREYSPETDVLRMSIGDAQKSPLRVVLQYNIKETYQNPGRLLQKEDGRGHTRLVQEGDWVFLAGEGRKADGEHPFLDRMNLSSLQKERLFQADDSAPYLEEFLFFLGGDQKQWVMSRESPQQPRNYWLRDRAVGKEFPLTAWLDQVPAMTSALKKNLVYKRKDGVTLSGELYLPSGYKAGQQLPAVIWAYPDEYRSAELAGQVRVSPRRYMRPSVLSLNWLVTQGYAVLDNAAMPLVGTKDAVNDSFREQIKANAEAAIEALESEGVSKRGSIAVGGHSYGAFMTANLLAHTELFCAGIARSGAYNRSLTPFGFQSERRTFWEAREFYMDVSPFSYADRMKAPLLLIHGKEDNNPGTQPLQTERLYQALRGVGAKARMVLLPYESHGYRAEENILRVHAETLGWLSRHCSIK